MKVRRRKKTEDWKGDIKLQGYTLNKVKSFKYLGSMLSADGELDEEVKKRIQVGYCIWLLSGVWCNRRLSARKKGKAKVAVKPAMTYGSETWGVKMFLSICVL